MSAFNKKEYDERYNREKRTCIRISVSKDEHAKFMRYIQESYKGCTASTYCKRLINADLMKRGYDPIFKA